MSATTEAPMIVTDRKGIKRTIQGRFRLLVGSHMENGKWISQGDVFESTANLLKSSNSIGSKKFERVGSSTKLTKDVYATKGKATQGQVSPSYEADQNRLFALEQELEKTKAKLEEANRVIANSNANYTPAELIESVGETSTDDDPLGDDDPFDAMTVQQLRSYAEDNEIDLGRAAKKEDIIALLRASAASA